MFPGSAGDDWLRDPTALLAAVRERVEDAGPETEPGLLKILEHVEATIRYTPSWSNEAAEGFFRWALDLRLPSSDVQGAPTEAERSRFERAILEQVHALMKGPGCNFIESVRILSRSED